MKCDYCEDSTATSTTAMDVYLGRVALCDPCLYEAHKEGRVSESDFERCRLSETPLTSADKGLLQALAVSEFGEGVLLLSPEGDRFFKKEGEPPVSLSGWNPIG